MDEATPAERVLAYHERTKHHPQRYARSLGYLDWESQPEPFRTFAGTERRELPLAADARTTPYGALYLADGVPAAPLTLESLATLCELSLGLSAWKEYEGVRWALRCNPSSGNLHPTEGYLLLGAGVVAGVAPGLHHYVSRDHLLERRGVPDEATAALLTAAGGPGGFLVGLSSVVWREAWKYGERAWRYCQHDVGHALGALRYAAATLGWRARRLDAVGDEELAALLGLNVGVPPDAPVAPDPEYADALVWIDTRPRGDGVVAAPAPAPSPPALASAALSATLRALAAGQTFIGQAEPPSTATVEWEVLAEVAEAAARPAGVVAAPPESAAAVAAAATSAPHEAPPAAATPDPAVALPPHPNDALPAATLIRRRRSAVAMDGQGTLPASAFFRMLARALPRPGVPPWDLLETPTRVHPVFFVHRVAGLAPGLYLLARRPGVVASLRAALSPGFDWAVPPGAPPGLPLHHLAGGDFRERAAALSCHQEIAADGYFSLGMLAEFGDRIRGRPGEDAGAWHYPRLFHEAGLLGQLFYLEAEAAGCRATGIGCYFDDLCHALLGLGGGPAQAAAADPPFQSLYHFTVGGPVEDDRLVTRAPYAHLAARRAVL